MGTGTSAKGRKTGKKSHLRCRRCGRHSYHFQKKKCAYCWYPDSKMRKHVKARKHDF